MATLLWAPAMPVAAHHSYAIFDLESIVTLEGTVTRYDWRNPHVYIYVSVTDTNGQAIEWELEGDPTPMMTRNGWTADTLRAGDRVTVRANPGKPPHRTQALLDSLTAADGDFLRRRAAGKAATAQAASIAGVWDGLRGFGSRRFTLGALTAKAQAARADYDLSQSPVADCIPASVPSLASAPHLHEIEVFDDRVLIKTEYFAVTRTVYTDGRGHPDSGERTTQGHSIGHWEGDVLVVDTRLFADHRTGNLSGIPSGAGKHVVERYGLSADRRQLIVSFTAADPEYLAEPTTGEIAWDYAPDRALLPSGCDPDTARRFLTH